jgi:GT2 family glycosyltransferase
MHDHEKVCAGFVTRDRREFLRKAMTSLLASEYPVSGFIVADNGSADGTVDMLRADFPMVKVIAWDRNRGISAGHAATMRYAMELGYDWWWGMDDDSAVKPNTLGTMLADSAVQAAGMAVPRVVLPSGETCPRVLADVRQNDLHFRGIVHGADLGSHIQTYPFQGILARKDRIAAAGVPREDIFLGCEDLEWTLRLSADQSGIVYVRAAEIMHDDRSVQIRKRFMGMTFIIPEPAALWKFYYSVRNRILISKMWHKPYLITSLLGFCKALIARVFLGAPRGMAADYRDAMLDGWRGIAGERAAGKAKR